MGDPYCGKCAGELVRGFRSLLLCKLRFCELELKLELRYLWCEGFGLDMVGN